MNFRVYFSVVVWSRCFFKIFLFNDIFYLFQVYHLSYLHLLKIRLKHSSFENNIDNVDCEKKCNCL